MKALVTLSVAAFILIVCDVSAQSKYNPSTGTWESGKPNPSVRERLIRDSKRLIPKKLPPLSIASQGIGMGSAQLKYDPADRKWKSAKTSPWLRNEPVRGSEQLTPRRLPRVSFPPQGKGKYNPTTGQWENAHVSPWVRKRRPEGPLEKTPQMVSPLFADREDKSKDPTQKSVPSRDPLERVLKDLARAPAPQPPKERPPLAQKTRYVSFHGWVALIRPNGVLGLQSGKGSFMPRAEGMVFLPDGTLAFERAGLLISGDGTIRPIFGEDMEIREVFDESGKRHLVPPGFDLVKESESGRHFFVPDGGKVVRDRQGIYRVLPPMARLAYDDHDKSFILPEGTHLERSDSGQSFVVPDGGRLERDANGQTFVVPAGASLLSDQGGRGHVVPEGMRLTALPWQTWPSPYVVLPPGANIVQDRSGKGHVVPEGMRLVELPSDTWPPRYALLPPGAKIVETEGGSYVVPKGGRLVRVNDDLWPPRYYLAVDKDRN